MNLKRGLLLLLMLSAMIVTSCDPESAINPKYRGTYTLKNNSDQDIKVEGSRLTPLQIAKNSSANLYFGDMFVMLGDKYNKDYFYDSFNIHYGKDTIAILSMEGDTLKVWKEVEKDFPGRQYYHLDFWEETQEKKGTHIYINWLFELLPEDLNTGK